MENKSCKRIMAMLLTIALVITMMPFPATVYAVEEKGMEASVIASGSCGETATWTLDENYVLTIGGTGVMEDYGGAIETRGWAEYTSKIKKLVIEEGIISTGSEGTEVGSYAFNDFTSLEEVTLPSTLEYIAFKTFPTNAPITTLHIADLESYCNIDVGHTWWSNGCYVMGSEGLDVYVDGKLVTELVIPGSFKKIRANAFMYWKNLTKVTVEDGVETIEDSCFNCCYALTEVNLPESVTTVGNYVFLSCHSLEELTLPNSATSIGASLISTNSSVPLKKLTMPITHRGTEIGGLNNGVPSSLTTFVFTPGTTGAGYDYNTASVTSYMSYKNTAWYYLRSHTLDVTLEEGITHIGNYMFKDCTGITELTIPSTVTSIGTEAIDSTVNLKVYHGTYGETFAKENGNSYEVLHNYKQTGKVASTCQTQGYITYKCQASKCTQTKTESLPLVDHKFETTAYTFEDGTEFGYCSYDCGTSNFEEEKSCTASGTSLDTVSWSLYDETYLILSGYGDMADCTTSPLEGHDVKYCYIEDGITSIGANFFANTDLSFIDIPDSVTDIDITAFSGCTSLEIIKLSEDHPVYHVSDSILSDPDGEIVLLYFGNEEEKAIPGQYTTIGAHAFVSSSADTKVIIPFGLASIESASALANVNPYVYDNSYARRYLERHNVSWNSKGLYQLPWENEDVHYQMAYDKLVKYLNQQPSKKVTTSFNMTNTGMAHTLSVSYADGRVIMQLTSRVKLMKYDTFVYLDENGLLNNEIYMEAALNGSVDQGYTGVLEIEPSAIAYGQVSRLWDIEAGYLAGAVDKASSTVLANQLLDVLLSNVSGKILDEAEISIADLGFKNFYANSTNTIHLNVEEANGITPGCETDGRTPDVTCKLCGAYQEGGPAEPTGHIHAEEYTVDKQATFTEDGNKSRHCTGNDCEEKTDITVIPKISTMTLSVTNYTYNGNAKKPTVTLKDSEGKTLKSGTDYTVTYKNNINAGTASVTVTAKGDYKGTMTKNFTISKATMTGIKATGKTVTYNGKAYTITVSGVPSGAKVYYKTSTTGKYTTTKPTRTSAGTTTVYYKVSKANYKDVTGSVKIVVNRRPLYSASLSATTYVYNGYAKKPTVTVKNSSGTKLKKDTHYTVSYKNNTKVGKATVTVTGKGNYKGTITKTFKINPKPTKITSLTKASKAFTVKWSKVTTQTTGYQIYYTTSTTRKNGKTYTVTNNKTTSKKFTGLKSKKKYYVWVRTYKTVNGTKYYSTWSARDYITTK